MHDNSFKSDGAKITGFSYNASRPLTVFDCLYEIFWSLGQHKIWMMLGYNALRAGTLRSTLGIIWLPLSLGITIGLYGVLFGGFFGGDNGRYFPYLASGWVAWRFIGGLFTQSLMVYVRSRSHLETMNFPLPVYVFAKIYELTVEFLLNLIVFAIVMGVTQTPISYQALLFFPAIMLYWVGGCSIAFSGAFFCARYPDIQHLVGPIITSMFFLTPIIWRAEDATGPQRIFVQYNPFHYALDIFRQAFGISPINSESWIIVTAFAGGGFLVSLFIYRFYSRRVKHWIV